MRPLDFVDLADRLIASEKNAPGFRTAISRAYYAAFLHARDFLHRMGVYLVTGNPHVEAVALLTNAGDVEVDRAVALLRDDRVLRNRADYDLGDRGIEDEVLAAQCAADARDVIAKLNGCRVSAPRAAAVAARVRANVNRLRGLPP